MRNGPSHASSRRYRYEAHGIQHKENGAARFAHVHVSASSTVTLAGRSILANSRVPLCSRGSNGLTKSAKTL